MILREIINLIGYEIDEVSFRQVEERSKALFDGIENFGKQMSMKVTAPIVTAAVFAVNEFTNFATTLAFIRQTIANTGGVAGKTAEELIKLSESLSGKSLYEGDNILEKVTGHLLMYDKIRGQTFDKAAQATVDLAARLKIDLASASRIVGRSLNDPIAGLMLLHRSQIGVTKAEIDYIEQVAKSGRIADAQSMVLDLLNRKVGGAAQAARDASSGFMIFRNKIQEVGKAFGEHLQSYFRKFYGALVKMLDKLEHLSPETKKTIIAFLGLAAAIGPLLVGLAGIGKLGLFIMSGIDAIAGALPELASDLGITVGATLGWVALIVVAIVGLFLIVEDFMVYLKGGDSIIGKFLAPWKELAPQIMQKIQPLLDWLQGMLQGALQMLKGILQIVVGLFSGNADMIVQGLKNIVVGFWNYFSNYIGLLMQMIVNFVPVIWNTLGVIEAKVREWIDKLLGSIVDQIHKIPLLGPLIAQLDRLGDKGINALFGAGSPLASSKTGMGVDTGYLRDYVSSMFPSSMAGTTNKNVNVNSTIAMTVPAGTQQQQIQAVQQAAEQAVKFEFYQQTKNAVWQMAR